MKLEIQKSLQIIEKGGTILYPTDTIWGIGCDATNIDALNKVNEIKHRPAEKRFILLVSSIAMLERYVAEIPDVAYDIIDLSPSPTTVILSKTRGLPNELLHDDGSIGIRVVNHPFCTQLIDKLRKPIVSTSANLSGQKSPENFYQIDNEILSSVDYVVNFEQELTSSKKPSSIIKFNLDGTFTIIRK